MVSIFGMGHHWGCGLLLANHQSLAHIRLPADTKGLGYEHDGGLLYRPHRLIHRYRRYEYRHRPYNVRPSDQDGYGSPNEMVSKSRRGFRICCRVNVGGIIPLSCPGRNTLT